VHPAYLMEYHQKQKKLEDYKKMLVNRFSALKQKFLIKLMGIIVKRLLMFSSNLKFLVSIFYYLLLLCYFFGYNSFPDLLIVFCELRDDSTLTYQQMCDYLDYIFAEYKLEYLVNSTDKFEILEIAKNCEDKRLRQLKLHIIDHLIKKCRENAMGIPHTEYEIFANRYGSLFQTEFANITTARRVADYTYFNRGTPY